MSRFDQYEGVMIFISLDLKIHLYRRETTIWKTKSSARYICYMDFINNLDMVTLSIHFTEDQAFAIIDELDNFLEFNELSRPISIGTNDLYGNYLMMCLERDIPDTPAECDMIGISIRQYNRNTEQIITRVHFICSEEFIANQIIYMMYFAYLIDIDDGRFNICNESLEDFREAVARDNLREGIIK